MPRDISAALLAHLQQSSTTLAAIVRITRADGTVMGFTSHDLPIEYAGLAYQPSPGLLPFDTEQQLGTVADITDVQAVIDGSDVTGADLLNGLFDGARFELGVINWASPADGAVKVSSGRLGLAERQGQVRWQAELRSFGQLLQEPVGRVATTQCGWLLGDSRCGVNLASFTYSGAITSVSSSRVFAASGLDALDEGWFNFGLIEFTSGPNTGAVLEVQQHAVGPVTITLNEDAAEPLAIGHAFSIKAGCDYTLAACRDKFSNVANYGGFPHMPDRDTVLKRE